jgi:hypothetical protein
MLRQIVEVEDMYIRPKTVSSKYYHQDSEASIKSRNSEYRLQYGDSRYILEISSASAILIGQQLSAMNLKLDGYSVESIYQSSKVFQSSEDNKEWLLLPGWEAKKKAAACHNLLGFNYDGIDFSLSTGALFYNWVYTKALCQSQLIEEVSDYSLFADIFFNPDKSRSCQAIAVAEAVCLHKNNLLNRAIVDLNLFEQLTRMVLNGNW